MVGGGFHCKGNKISGGGGGGGGHINRGGE